MRGSVEVHAIGTDVASPSISRLRAAPLALDMMRYQRFSPDCLPLGNGGGGGSVPRKPASRTSYKDDDDAPDVATDGSRLAASLQVESKPPLRARAPQPTPLSSAGRSPARDHHTSDSSDTASPSSTVGDVLLQWGHKKRSRCRRDSAATAQHGVGIGGKIQRRASAPPEKLLMPPPPPAAGSYTRGSSHLRSASSSVAARSSSGAGDGRHGGHCPPNHHHRSVEERSGGVQQKRSSPDNKTRKSGTDAVLLHMESKNHHHHHSPLTANGSVAGNKLGVELPRIYVALSRKEKEDDFLAMKGTKLPQRPKKRAKNVDKTLQFVFPGMWLSDLTKGRYEVREKKSVKKKRRGLKGMESMDSDSE